MAATQHQLSSGHTAKELEGEEFNKYIKDFTGNADGLLEINPGKWILPRNYLDFEKTLYNFQFRPDDVLIMTYPKCGTTWMQEIVWTMRNNPNLDNPLSGDMLYTRSPFLDLDFVIPKPKGRPPPEMMNDPLIKPMNEAFDKYCRGRNPKDGLNIQIASCMLRNRTLKTHLPFSLWPKNLPEKCKVIFVARNPKDAALSYMHHCRLIRSHGFASSQDTFINYFVKDRLLWGSYSEMIIEAWKMKDHPNVHFVFYEDLRANIDSELRKINDFIGTGLNTEQLENVKKHTSFNSMKANDPIKMDKSMMANQEQIAKEGSFIRQGKSGTWKEKLSRVQEAKIDMYVREKFAGTGLSFKYE